MFKINIIFQVREIRQSSQGSNRDSGSGNYQPYTIQKGIVTVGKISFDAQHILGKGCEGTFVFRYVCYVIRWYMVPEIAYIIF